MSPPVPLALLVLAWLAPCAAGPARAAAAAPAGGHVLQADMSDEEEGEGQARFEAALRLLGAGQERAAADALQALARERPDDDVAPEALFEAAQIHEEQLAEPEAALRLYGELLQRYPQSRLIRRAQGREAELRAGLRSGPRPYLELQAILRSFPAPDTIFRLERLLREHPDFVLADRVRFLLGSALSDAGRGREAERALEDLLRRRPAGEWAPRALQLLGQLQLQRGDYAGARARFVALSSYGGPLWEAAAAQGLWQVARARRRAGLAGAAAAYLVLLAVGLGVRGRRRLWPPPLELSYYLPAGGFLLLAAALGAGGPVRQAVLRLVLGGAALCWLGGAAASALAESPSVRPLWPRLLLGSLLRVLAAAALGYLVVAQGGLLEVVLETLRNGPERE